MKKYLTIVAIAGLMLCGCSSDLDEGAVSDVTEADVFVASEKYQNYQSLVQREVKAMRKTLKGLPKGERREFHQLSSAMREAKSYDDLLAIEDKMGDIIGMDCKESFERIAKARMEAFKGVRLSKESLLMAVQKYNALNQPIEMTRSGLEITKVECYAACDQIYFHVFNECMDRYDGWYYYEQGYYYGDANALQEYLIIARSCSDMASLASLDCQLECDDLYG